MSSVQLVPLGSLSSGACFQLANGSAVYVIIDPVPSVENIAKAFRTNLYRSPPYSDPSAVPVGKVMDAMGTDSFVWCVSLQGGILCSYKKDRMVVPGWGGFMFKAGQDGP